MEGEVLRGGNGQITAADWVQAGWSAAGLDAVMRATGPAGAAAGNTAETEKPSAG